MARQPSYRPDEPSSFFADGRSNRPVVAGTVARGQLRTDAHFYRGIRFPEAPSPADTVAFVGAAGTNLWSVAAAAVAQSSDEANAAVTFPFPVTEQVMRHGQNRYMIYCVVCHDALGSGHGMIVQRGYTAPPSFHSERLRQAPVGHFFQVITKGYGSMPSYGKQVPPRDRWAIAAYVRALQLSQHFSLRDLPADLGDQWAARGAAALLAPEAVGGKP
jgi:mono/diheme cytochrome c family protein